MPAICMYVAFLQRQTQAPTIGHVRDANRLMRWIRKSLKSLGVHLQRLKEPLRLGALSDSAFKAQDYEGLAMRGCVIVFAEAEAEGSGLRSHAKPCSWHDSQVPASRLVLTQA